MADYSYLGAGKIYIREYGTATPLIEVGNCSQLAMSISEETKELKDYTKGGGGTYNEVRRITGAELTITAHDLSPSNLARVLYGTTTAIAAGSVSNEVRTAYKGGFVTLLFPASAVSSVTGPSGTPTYTLGTDYEVRSGGLWIPATSTIVDGATIEVDYTKAAGDAVEALLNSGKEWQIVFEGLNEARSGKLTLVEIHRARLGAAQNLSLIGEDYAALEISGKILKDTTKNGTTVSQYFKTTIVQ